MLQTHHKAYVFIYVIIHIIIFHRVHSDKPQHTTHALHAVHQHSGQYSLEHVSLICPNLNLNPLVMQGDMFYSTLLQATASDHCAV